MWNSTWDGIYSSREWGKYPAESVVRFAARNLYPIPKRSDITVLDAGCGTGTNAWFLAREGFQVIGVDGSAVGLERARKRFANEGLSGDFRLGELTALPIESESVDAVVDGYAFACCSLVNHRQVLKEVWRVLKPGGYLYSIFPDVNCWGYSTGRVIDEYHREAVEGPFQGQGPMYFFDEHEIHRQYTGFVFQSLELETRSEQNRAVLLVDWVLDAVKPS